MGESVESVAAAAMSEDSSIRSSLIKRNKEQQQELEGESRGAMHGDSGHKPEGTGASLAPGMRLPPQGKAYLRPMRPGQKDVWTCRQPGQSGSGVRGLISVSPGFWTMGTLVHSCLWATTPSSVQQ